MILAMYLTTLSCKPHIVSKGKNWVMKEFGVEIGNEYKANKAVFNEFYFKYDKISISIGPMMVLMIYAGVVK